VLGFVGTVTADLRGQHGIAREICDALVFPSALQFVLRSGSGKQAEGLVVLLDLLKDGSR
jgi:hypothetical protein